MMEEKVSVPRLCSMKREDIGYGFNIHGEKGLVGQYISAVDTGGSAYKSGLCVGDRIIEVNGINVENCSHSEVVGHIKTNPEKTKLLVIDQITDKYLAAIGRPVTADMVNLISVAELSAPEPTLSEMMDRIVDLQSKEKEDIADVVDINGEVNIACYVQTGNEETLIQPVVVQEVQSSNGEIVEEETVPVKRLIENFERTSSL